MPFFGVVQCFRKSGDFSFLTKNCWEKLEQILLENRVGFCPNPLPRDIKDQQGWGWEPQSEIQLMEVSDEGWCGSQIGGLPPRGLIQGTMCWTPSCWGKVLNRPPTALWLPPLHLSLGHLASSHLLSSELMASYNSSIFWFSLAGFFEVLVVSSEHPWFLGLTYIFPCLFISPSGFLNAGFPPLVPPPHLVQKSTTFKPEKKMYKQHQKLELIYYKNYKQV